MYSNSQLQMVMVQIFKGCSYVVLYFKILWGKRVSWNVDETKAA